MTIAASLAMTISTNKRISEKRSGKLTAAKQLPVAKLHTFQPKAWVEIDIIPQEKKNLFVGGNCFVKLLIQPFY